ncbi:MAG: ECF transporter S component, partial [Oscillospiraceae bacterium]|nr:ECF transporter S component [Oscillospiraceae bacterium]
MENVRTSTRKLVALSILSALIVILQLISNVVKVGPVSITLSLVPIVVGAALYDVGAGAYLGGVLGLVVLICCITGIDVGGSILWNVNPLMTAIVCLGKTIAAGACSSAVYRAIRGKNQTVAALCAGMVCPVVNTGIFCLSMVLFFHDTLVAWAGGTE